MVFDPEKTVDDLYTLRVQVSQQADLITSLQEQQAILKSQIVSSVVGAPAIRNYIRNGDYSHSFNTHQEAVPGATDSRYECWEVYQDAAPFVGQFLRGRSVYGGSIVSDSDALPDPGRSDTPTTDPYWNRSIGYAMLGSTRTIDFPLLLNVAYPGRIFYVPLIVARRSVNVGVPGRLYAGVWDNTAGQRDWLNGDGFAITAEVIGTPAATTSTDYCIVMTNDFGKTVKSAVLTVAGAPSDASFISGSVYVRLTWPRFAGFIQSDIYRKRAGIFQRLAQQSTVNQYFDQGDVLQVVGNYPDTDLTKQQAYTATQEGFLDDAPIDGVDPAWRQIILALEIPPTYDQSLTTDKQWVRIGLDEACDGTDAAHGLLIDLTAFSPDAGVFAHHPEDEKGLQNPIAAPAGSSQGGAGTGGSGFQPPDPGSGGGRCIAPTSAVFLAVDPTKPYTRLADSLRMDYAHLLLSVNDQGELTTGAIERMSDGIVERICTMRTKIGIILRCSEEQRIITRIGDTTGTPLKRLRKGDPVICYEAKSKSLQETTITSIVRKTQPTKRCRVIRIHMTKDSPQIFIAGEGGRGGILAHNIKPEESQV